MVVIVAYALSRVGLWLKREDLKSETPIVIIQSVAVFLAPMSLLFVALLFGDSDLSFPVRMIWGVFLSGALLLAWRYIFAIAVMSVYRAMAGIHSWTLLITECPPVVAAGRSGDDVSR